MFKAKRLISGMAFRFGAIVPVPPSCVVANIQKPFSGRANTASTRDFA